MDSHFSCSGHNHGFSGESRKADFGGPLSRGAAIYLCGIYRESLGELPFL